MGPRRRLRRRDLCLYALCVEPELTRWEHGPLPSSDEVRAGTALERVANTLLRKDLDELLPEQVEVCADLHLRPYYGDEDDTDGLYHSVAKRGTTAFHAYATLARVKNKRYTLAVRRLKDGDTASSVPLSSSVSSTALTPGSRPSTLIADSTTVSVSRCFRRTITRT